MGGFIVVGGGVRSKPGGGGLLVALATLVAVDHALDVQWWLGALLLLTVVT